MAPIYRFFVAKAQIVVGPAYPKFSFIERNKVESLNFLIDPSLPAAYVAALSGVAGLIWWLIRKRQKRIWLPTMRIMTLESRILPRLVFRPPPIMSFLCFIFLALLMLFFSLKPRTQILTPFEPNQKRIHLFVDLSPSLSAHLSIEDYAERLSQLIAALGQVGRLTYSTSYSPDIYDSTSGDDLRARIVSLGYHRSGIKLGNAIKKTIESLGEVDRLIVASDRDQHSWTGFYWRYLLDDMDVMMLDLSQDTSIRDNYYFSELRFASVANSQTMDWEVDIARNSVSAPASGELVVLHQGQELARTSWTIAAEKSRTTARLSWPAHLLGNSGAVQAGSAQSPLLFRIRPEASDRLSADNEFRVMAQGIRQDILLIADTNGERPLEDPAKQLAISLEIQGFRVKRMDFVEGAGPTPAAFPFWVLVGGMGSGVDRFCPKSLQNARNAVRDSVKASLPKVWLAPYSVDADYRELCQCYARLLKVSDNSTPEYCEHVGSRSQWLTLLPSLGAKQLGGEIGDASAALAFRGRHEASKLEVLAFTVPLMPIPGTSLNHAQFPILIRDILQWQGQLAAASNLNGAGWPRSEDATQTLWQPSLVAEARTRIIESNVPIAESLLADTDGPDLPPRWTSSLDSDSRSFPLKKDREDPLPWLKLIAILVASVTILEAVAWMWGLFSQRFARRAQLSVVIFAAVFVAPKSAQAKVALSLLGYDQAGLTFDSLAREVAQRTSIELFAKPEQFNRLTLEAQSQPWLWVKSLGLLMGSDAKLNPDALVWLRRGGFLIVEAALSDVQLKQLAVQLAPEAAVAGTAFEPLPPDHELLRSFYLLDALPPCNDQIWRGLRWDGRLAILIIPYGLLESLKDGGHPPVCPNPPDEERSLRVFVNLVMVALATDYKKDQIHLPEILKRLR